MRGERRRAELIAATLRVVEADGVAGVTHRAVAREAGVPASSAVYHFATLDDLLVAALTSATDTYVEQLEAMARQHRDVPAALAGLVADGAGTDRRRALAECELTLLAVRRPALRPAVRRYLTALTEAVACCTGDPTAVRAAVAAVDGLFLQGLLDERGVEAAEIRGVLVHILGGGGDRGP
ncbi:TetR/AcrR family transcriptional regulator [Streptomonospora wellingtoniae]|uniref:TetR family transcriptional regulator n=1 Tax=Streptomonospora wellingtoniae TaxID=3075544 RepID=A0ABU2KPD5_9ACTN|nr:TetR family transcriptional regulator [Streptomonospora sp. DSM 45055]MDT0301013.1 TetR family transcriptional regulator [Streptomonospora sp. DSM 45055]